MKPDETNLEKLPAKKQKAIVALLECPTIEKAAASAGISKATMFRWLQIPEFRDAYREARAQWVQQAVARIQRASGEAVDVLTEVMLDTEAPPSTRIAAAKTVLGLALEGIELEDLTARVEALEKLAANNGRKTASGNF